MYMPSARLLSLSQPCSSHESRLFLHEGPGGRYPGRSIMDVTESLTTPRPSGRIVAAVFVLAGVCGIWQLVAFPGAMLPQWEAIWSAAGSMLFCLSAATILRSGGPFWIKGAALGAGCGVLLLLNPALLIVDRK